VHGNESKRREWPKENASFIAGAKFEHSRQEVDDSMINEFGYQVAGILKGQRVEIQVTFIA
jgi:FKBP-type peptidyl-prolyl cis-trans isomerase (trigger factor)